MARSVKSTKQRPKKSETNTFPLKKLQPSGKAESSFFEQVFDIVEQVPRGKVTTYGAIAKALGSGLSARMVGWALNSAHSQTRPIPAQRVVNRNGQLSGKGHFATPTLMQELLEKEGISIENDTIKNFSKHFWDPASEHES
ncbi:MGMT family protein [Flavihumibacter profundi]|jgi:methylated-DNA-protein-cysteine methyltransferase related protein|uniref:MGMT family protein n=1 Tax=Flavihumibacter profundi TaxID=2716883 RepID=UPI001CC676F3|nr:MGMT family protein [Flavihumibacter profundi]MBZ5858959.1 MGMT family protein [Flavihumibacter profundi]